MQVTPPIDQILNSETIWLSTHKNADGDGLGSEVAFYFALKTLGRKVQIIHNDSAPKRYRFLTEKIDILSVDHVNEFKMSDQDILVVFDTHDPLLCAPLFGIMQEKKIRVLFIDHHIPIKQNLNLVDYLIDESASCTGEIVFDLIKKLSVAINSQIATPLYASLIFDTQNFKFIRGSSRPFAMATELLNAGADHHTIQQNLFNNWTIQKMNYLAHLIKNVEYKDDQKIALIKIDQNSLALHQLEADDVSDLIDLFMGIQSLDVAIVIREEGKNYYKLSFRSRTYEVLSWARSFNGGGHLFSAGAWVREPREMIEQKIENLILQRPILKASSQ
ncbi:MAG: DHH family phosphoesterase [Bdellovibrionaceae bacterium]|nr:DHH family phosphoesterase [Bdellovibrio sp.]